VTEESRQAAQRDLDNRSRRRFEALAEIRDEMLATRDRDRGPTLREIYQHRDELRDQKGSLAADISEAAEATWRGRKSLERLLEKVQEFPVNAEVLDVFGTDDRARMVNYLERAIARTEEAIGHAESALRVVRPK
jgi:hypothetical protein